MVFAPKTFSISTTCLLWRETFLIILPRAEARGNHIVAPTELLFSKSDFPEVTPLSLGNLEYSVRLQCQRVRNLLEKIMFI
jgi:hypothetical protein